jgi:hypothetical protein
MTRWRLWFNAVNGLKPSVELVQAMKDLDPRTVRRVLRLTRRGKVTSGISEARLAVAFAHQTRQRAPTPSAYAAFAAMVSVCLGIFLLQAVLGEIDALGILVGAAGLWFVSVVILGRIRLRNALTAERLNLEILHRSSEPYSPSWSLAQIEVPPAASAAIAVFMFFLYALPYGSFQLIGGKATHSASDAITAGVFFGVFMTIFQLTMGRSLTQRRSEQKANVGIPADKGTELAK